MDYKPTWTQDFLEIGSNIRAALGCDALATHHIGSTGVPNLAAKDVINIQITVAKLEEEVLKAALENADFICRPEFLASALVVYLNDPKLILIL